MTERKTDLAMEVRESFPRDNVEIKGVVLEKRGMKKVEQRSRWLRLKMKKEVKQ